MVDLTALSSANLTTGLQLFFDDEIRNKEVESLGKHSVILCLFLRDWIWICLPGVTFCLVPDGIDAHTFEKGLGKWRKRCISE